MRSSATACAPQAARWGSAAPPAACILQEVRPYCTVPVGRPLCFMGSPFCLAERSPHRHRSVSGCSFLATAVVQECELIGPYGGCSAPAGSTCCIKFAGASERSSIQMRCPYSYSGLRQQLLPQVSNSGVAFPGCEDWLSIWQQTCTLCRPAQSP